MITTNLPTVDTTILDSVTGGIIAGGSYGNSSCAFQQIQSLLASLQNGNGGCNHNNDGMSPITMMMMALALRNEAPRPTLVYGPPVLY
jgi:hypothetical protein